MVGIGTPTLGTAPRKKKPEEEGVGKIPQPVATPAPGGLGAPASPPAPGTGNLAQNPPTGALPIGGAAVNPNDAPSMQGPPSGEAINAQTGAPVTTGTPLEQQGANNQPTPTVDSEIEALVRRLLSGQADTAEREALVREIQGYEEGKSLVGNRASMGRAGMASTGALAAMQADAVRAARQAAAQQILDLRATEDQRAIDNALAGGQLDIGMRDAATREREARAKELALQNLLESQGVTVPTEEGGGSADLPYLQDGAEGVAGAVLPTVTGDAGGGGSNAAATTDPYETATTGAGGITAEEAANALRDPPAGYEPGRTVMYEGHAYRQYTGPNGATVWVRE